MGWVAGAPRGAMGLLRCVGAVGAGIVHEEI